MRRYLSLFVGLILALSLIFNLEAVDRNVLKPWNQVLANASYATLHSFDKKARLSGNVLSSEGSGFAVAVENDCNGLEVTLLLLAAVLIFPSTWKEKIVGILLGFLAIQTLNVVRIVTLFYLGQWDEAVFKWTHQYLWPVLIVLASLLVFVAWIQRLSSHRSDPPIKPAT